MFVGAVREALTITGFVVMMMLLVEYLNVFRAGRWGKLAATGNWRQYLLAALLGAIPGCLGPWAVVAMFSHGLVSLGAVVAAMIATSGDESFVMLAVIPKQAPLLFGALALLGVAAGALTDSLARNWKFLQGIRCEGLVLHAVPACEPYPRGQILAQWKQCSAVRGLLVLILVVLLAGILTGELGTWEGLGIRAAFVVLCAAALFIVSTVPDHFLEDHLWQHVVRKHGARIFWWTLGALVVMHVLVEELQVVPALQGQKWLLLLAACAVGLIPESGPHLVFVTLYAKGALPLGVLLASSIVQDGHGMLPLLAESRRSFVVIKAINLLVGLLVGAAVIMLGY